MSIPLDNERLRTGQDTVQIKPLLKLLNDPLTRDVAEWGRHGDPDTWSRGVTIALQELGVDRKFKPTELGGYLDVEQYAKFVGVCAQLYDGLEQFNALINGTGVLGEARKKSIPEFWIATTDYVKKHGPEHQGGYCTPYIEDPSGKVFVPVEDTIKQIALPAFDIIRDQRDFHGLHMSERGEILTTGFVLSSFHLFNKRFPGYRDENRSKCASDQQYYAQPMRMFGLVASAIYTVDAVDAMYSAAGKKQVREKGAAGTATSRRSARAVATAAGEPLSVDYVAFNPRTVESYKKLIDTMWKGFSDGRVTDEQRAMITELKTLFETKISESRAMTKYMEEQARPRQIVY